MTDTIRVRTPATTANLGPGFDFLGMALKIYNEVEMSRTEGEGYQLSVEGLPDSDHVPRDEHNLVFRAARKVFEMAGTPPGALNMKIRVNTPLARGLGSSASAIVGGMTAANELLGKPFDDQKLVYEMVAMERHPDNVVSAYYGGLTASLVLDNRIMHRKYLPAANVACVLLIPGYELSTSRARQAIPKNVPFRDAAFNLARIPFLIDKLTTGDLSGMGAIMDDRLHQPYRKPLIRDYDVLADEAESAGAAAVCLSGAGPTMLALCDVKNADNVAAAMRRVLDSIGIPCRVVVTSPDTEGTIVTRIANTETA